MENYRTFWVNVKSSEVLVMPAEPRENEKDFDNDVEENLISDYNDDMYVSESRTTGYSEYNPGFTVSPILDSEDQPDQTDSRHETHEDNHKNIDFSRVTVPSSISHEISKPAVPIKTNNFHDETPTTVLRNRPSILITPPLRPRRKSTSKSTSASSPLTTPQTQQTINTVITDKPSTKFATFSTAAKPTKLKEIAFVTTEIPKRLITRITTASSIKSTTSTIGKSGTELTSTTLSKWSYQKVQTDVTVSNVPGGIMAVSYTHLTLPTICSV